MSKQITVNDIISFKVNANGLGGAANDYLYRVDWGDGSSDNGRVTSPFYVAHKYTSAGVFSPTLRIEDVRNGCWDTLYLDTVYVIGLNLKALNPSINIGDNPQIQYTFDGSRDIAAGNSVTVLEKWYFGDGNSVSTNYWHPRTFTTQPYTVSLSALALSTYQTNGNYKVWVAVKVYDSTVGRNYQEVGEPVDIYVGGGVTPPADLPEIVFTGVLLSGIKADLSLKISKGNGPFSAVIEWGDGVSESVTGLPFDTELTYTHSYPGSEGASARTVRITASDSEGYSSSKEYSFYVVPEVSIMIQDAGSCLSASSAARLSTVFSGKSPYTVYLEVIVKQSYITNTVPRLNLTIVTDTTEDTTSVTAIYPTASTFYGPGTYAITLSPITKDFTLALDHNMGAESLNSFTIRAWAVDSLDRESEKITLTRCGVDNVTSVGTKGF